MWSEWVFRDRVKGGGGAKIQLLILRGNYFSIYKFLKMSRLTTKTLIMVYP
jgi:hypothetical protein